MTPIPSPDRYRRTVSRRAALAGIAAATVGTAALASTPTIDDPTPAAELDAEIKRLWREWRRLHDTFPDTDDDDVINAAGDELTRVEEEMLACPAESGDGLMIKMRFLVFRSVMVPPATAKVILTGDFRDVITADGIDDATLATVSLYDDIARLVGHRLPDCGEPGAGDAS